MTYTLVLLDASEGLLLWIKVALAATAGIILPILEPYEHTDVDVGVSPLLSLEEFDL
jgi:hypothetical protein